MKKYTYLIVGGGMTADAAVRGIRELDPKGSIALLTEEHVLPYARPPLSKDLWSGEKTVDDLDCGTEELDVDLFVGTRAVALNTATKRVSVSTETFQYEKLLLATGIRPNALPFKETSVLYYRTLSDYWKLIDLLEQKEHFAVIGGGFIGCEMTAALLRMQTEVTMIFPEDAPGGRAFPNELANALSKLYRSRGANLLPGLKLSGIECEDTHCFLSLENGHSFSVEGVLAGVGSKPNTELAEAASLKVDDGIVVNRQLETSDASIFAAGDVARFYNPTLDRYIRVEHEDNALTMGRMAGRNMAGAKENYDHLPYFYSDLFNVGYEAVGLLDSSLQVVGQWKGLEEKNVFAYLENDRVCGVLLWNLFGQVDTARELIGNTYARYEIPLLEGLLHQLIEDAGKEGNA
jgi:NADPH-dependent 2,4-dienoyl-CoA reductase/sulfur reductase-like enzyme